MLRRLYHALAILAITHLMAVTGLVAYLVTSGRLGGQQVDAITKVLRGELPPEAWADAATTSQPTTQPVVAETAQGELARTSVERDTIELLAARARRELTDQTNLLRVAELDFDRKRAELKREREAFRALQDKVRQQQRDEGYRKMIECYSTIQPKMAKSLLMKKKDADTVAILQALEARQRTRIIEECKTPEELEWIGRILDLIRDADVQRADGLGETGGR